MNRYHLKVIVGSTTENVIIDAERMGWAEAGLYEFVVYEKTKNGPVSTPIAYYPVDRTIVEKIEVIDED